MTKIQENRCYLAGFLVVFSLFCHFINVFPYLLHEEKEFNKCPMHEEAKPT